MIKNPPANAGDMGSIPKLTRSHMLWIHLSLCTRTAEPCSATREAMSVRSTDTAAGEEPPAHHN